jgi:hypothetical protein
VGNPDQHGFPEQACFTRAVGFEVAAAAPAEFVATTTTRIAWPKSSGTSVYVALVAPSIALQLAPLVSQRSHS